MGISKSELDWDWLLGDYGENETVQKIKKEEDIL